MPNLKHNIFNCYRFSYYFHTKRGMALFKFFKQQQEKSSERNALLSRKEVEITDKTVAKALESASKWTVSRGKYNYILVHGQIKETARVDI